MRQDVKVLVTGAGGFIGKVAVSTLVARGWQVKAMMRRPRASSVDVVLADMQDEFSLRAALDSVDVVVHLAAAKADEPDSDSVNVEGARRLVAACQEVGCRRCLHHEGEGTILVDRNHDRNDTVAFLLGLGIELLAKLHNIDPVLTERRANGRSRIGFPSWNLQLDERRNFFSHCLLLNNHPSAHADG